MLDPSANTLEEVRGVLDQYRGAGYQLGITALYVLLSPILLLRHEPEAALEVIEQGVSTANHNSERIFEAELHRLKARALLVCGASGGGTHVESLLDQALTTARSQYAHPLNSELRKTLSRFGSVRTGAMKRSLFRAHPCLVHRRIRHARSKRGKGFARSAAIMRAGEEIVSASAGAPPLQLIEAPGERLAHA